MKLFSIITVCLNAEETIENTIVSVLNQNFTDFEYIIQDGCSNDRTVEIAERYSSAFADRGIQFLIFSEPDKGVYDAMNIATQKAQGQWVLYMNAGDCFADITVLDKVSKYNHMEEADILYGDVILRDNNMYKYQKADSLDNIRFYMPFCHQSVLVRKNLLQLTPFSLQYKLLSDYLFFLKAYLSNKKFEYITGAISIYDINGLSSNACVCHKERLSIYENMPVRDEEAIIRTKKILHNEEHLYRYVRKYVPAKILQKRRDYFARKNGWKTKEEFFSHVDGGE
ncbi:MAG: glycosyltransferase family 2 protein [Lachnospiraceae bacterium]